MGITLQFRHISCQEALHSIRQSLLLRGQHSLPSYVLFVDLDKAFDTIQHELLFQILSKYGLPKELINVVEKLYKNCKVKLTISDTKELQTQFVPHVLLMS